MIRIPTSTSLVATIAGLTAILACGNNIDAASISSGTSTAYGANVDVTAVGSLLSVEVDQLGKSTGSAPAAYTHTSSIPLNASAGISLPPITTVSLASVTGALNTSASSTVDGLTGMKTTSASASTANLNIALGSITVLGSTSTAVSITGGVITSAAAVMSDGTTLTSAGSSTLTGLTVHVGTNVIDLSAYLNASGQAAANTTIGANVLGIAGLTIVLNEQVQTASGIEVNAIHIEANALNSGILNLGLLNADIIISHSEAFEFAGSGSGANPPTATPLPDAASLGALGMAGSAGLAALKRRLRRPMI